MFKKMFKTDDSYTGLILRITISVMMLPMGYLKIIDFSSMMGILQTNYSLPSFIAILVIVIEFFIPFLLLAGYATRIGALLIAIIMFGAMFYHTQHGYHMNWYNLQEGEGYQFHLLSIGTALALVFSGGGKLSLDRVLYNKK